MPPKPRSILLINPNTTPSMTTTVLTTLTPLSSTLTFTPYTAPPSSGAPRSINSPADADASTAATIPSLTPLVDAHDGFLVACYSGHPLVPWLRSQAAAAGTEKEKEEEKAVFGILETSVIRALAISRAREVGRRGFGVVTSGEAWRVPLEESVSGYIEAGADGNVCGQEEKEWFVGVESCGLTAGELHALAPEEVDGRMAEAARRVLRRTTRDGEGVGTVVLGCAGMGGLEGVVGRVCEEVLGEGEGEVVDGVRAAVEVLERWFEKEEESGRG